MDANFNGFFPFEEDFKRLDKFYVNGTVSKWSFVH
jgi:hypothetical protein